ncbi:pyridoxal-phosphate dependent enzyme [Bradyrhizobium sp. SZCCHNR2035]|uniref:pyridoxal-phosphate dependent enzyme n=1 Tax=Bradyrhizobium sp. SZCCHNR2035 TaxID=3057386 RepID=UPI0029167F64|nr:pyridoxal-phosphate dependent enzyme [Bradyrhizobium sp. SZCCHNR2035]
MRTIPTTGHTNAPADWAPTVIEASAGAEPAASAPLSLHTEHAHEGKQALILKTARDLPFPPIFADLSSLVDGRVRLMAKIEQFNPAGSIKMKPAVGLLNAIASEGKLRSTSIVVDTSSGNMGIALSMAARSHGVAFLCVTDEKITPHNRQLIEAYGGTVHIMAGSTHKDRCRYISRLLDTDSRYLWTRQFEDRRNPLIHEETTAREIFNTFPTPDCIFVGVGTGGTIAGCAALRDQVSPRTRIFAVDPAGSYHFDESRMDVIRRIPGIGATERSPFLNDVRIDGVAVVRDEETVHTCLKVRDRTGWLLGGSSGSVLSAAINSALEMPIGSTVLAVCADSGERYLSTIYDRTWRECHGFEPHLVGASDAVLASP